ncbi:MAG TPA: histidine phosphatase family protein [Propionibacteriaceae bacterium]|nr:histidine phosphatase family protein [Propionibacteriaceae bacterium]
MRSLYLMRHAKAEHYSIHGDKGRHLAPRGRHEAAAVGVELADKGIQHVLCSSSQRTRDTFDALGLKVPVEYMDALYLGGTSTLRQRISEIDDSITALMVIGHAPSIPSLSAQLAYASQPKEADEMQCWFPTAAYAAFHIEGSWAALADEDPEVTRLAGISRPSEHR